VDILGAAATVAVALAAIDTADVLYLLWVAVAVVGIGFMLEPRVAEQPRG
jgi:beta-lactamase regulating signal transducer with metallopeptidase domain